jgi:outer membrane receptor protein involved in Fe transport
MCRKGLPSWSALVLIGALLCFWLGTSVKSHAQQVTGDVVGTVTDNTGGVIPGASVTIKNQGTGEARTAKSNEQGEFTFPLLQPGTYSVTVEAKGFKAQVQSGINLSVGQRFRADAHMSLGQVSETVQVNASEAPALQTDSSTLQSVVGEQSVEQLPLNGRNFLQLATLAPGANEGTNHGVNGNDPRPNVANLVVNAQSETANNYMIDGMDSNDRIWGLAGVRPSVDAIQEVNTLTGQYTADVGRTAGAVVNVVTKAGTSKLHGSLFDFLRNDVFDARGYFALAGAARPPFRMNQFGASVGGPIQKNKTFFFADYEGLRQLQATPGAGTVPTLLERTVKTNASGNYYDFSDIGMGQVYLTGVNSANLSKAAYNYYRLFPLPNATGINGGTVNNYVSTMPVTQNGDNFDARIDHIFSDKTSIFGRYSYNGDTQVNTGQMPAVTNFVVNQGLTGATQSTISTPIYPGGATNDPSRVQNVQVNFTHAIGAATVLELVGGYTRIRLFTNMANTQALSQMFGIPNANLGDQYTTGLASINLGPAGYGVLGDQTFTPNLIFDGTQQYMATLSHTRGTHNLKAGVSVLRAEGNQFQNRWGEGMYIFAGPAGNLPAFLSGWGPFPGGTPITGLRANLMQVQDLSTWEYAAYAQDNWRATKNLTVNLGVRYSIFTPYTEKNNFISSFDPNKATINFAGLNGIGKTAGINTDYLNFSPRLGAAYTVRNGTVVRAGFAMSFFSDMAGTGIYLKNTPEEISWQGGNSMDQGMPKPVATTPQQVLANPASISGALTGIDPNIKTPYTEQISVNIEQQVKGFVATLGYVSVLTKRMDQDQNINQSAPGDPNTAAGPGPGGSASRLSTAPYASVFPNVNEDIQLLMSSGTGNYNSLQASVERRYGRNLAVSANYTWAHALNDTMSMDGRNQAEGWGNVLVNGPWYTIPAQTHRNEYGNSDFDVRHRVSINANYQIPVGGNLNGIAGVLAKGWALNGIYVFMTGQPFSVTSGVNGGQLGTNSSPPNNQDRPNIIGNWKMSKPTPSEFFNVAAFALQPAGTMGTERRNQLYGPKFRHLDLSMGKQVAIAEGKALQFRVECFNLTNTTNFNTPNNSLPGGSTPGVAPSVGQQGFGVLTNTRFSPRQIQFALKATF